MEKIIEATLGHRAQGLKGLEWKRKWKLLDYIGLGV